MIRTKSVWEKLPGAVGLLLVERSVLVCMRMRHCAHTSAHQLSVRKHNFHTRVHLRTNFSTELHCMVVNAEYSYREVIAVWRIPHTSLHSIAQDGATPKVRNIDPQLVLQASSPELLIQLFVGHTRLDEAVGVLLVDFQDTVHVLTHVDANAAGYSGGGTTVADIASDGDFLVVSICYITYLRKRDFLFATR